MAHISYDARTGQTENIFARALNKIGETLAFMAESNPRLQQAQALVELSDAELAKRGLKREEIAGHVFGGWV